MKDILNFDITTKAESAGVRYTMRHKKRDGLTINFTTANSVRAEHIPQLIQGVFKAWMNRYVKVTRQNLTPKQKKFYDMVVWFHKQEGRPPSHDEQCDIMGWKSKGTSFAQTNRLIAKGWFWRDEDGRVIPIDIAAPDMTE